MKLMRGLSLFALFRVFSLIISLAGGVGYSVFILGRGALGNLNYIL